MKTITEFKCLQFASNAYLTEQLPDDWEDLEEEEQEKFLNDHVWELLENSSEDVYGLIEDHALHLEEFLRTERGICL